MTEQPSTAGKKSRLPLLLTLLGAGAPLLGALFTVLAIGAAASGAINPPASGGPGGVVCTVTVTATAASTAASPSAAAPPAAAPPSGLGGAELSPTQLGYARLIVATAKTLPVDRDSQQLAGVIALMVGDTESGLLNLANPTVPDSLGLPHDGEGVDSDSVGLFQQRPSRGWGTVAQLMDPAYATAEFYRALLPSANWQRIAPWAAAQQVQASGDPTGSNYAAYYALGTALTRALWDTTSGTVTCTTTGASEPTGPAGPVPGAPAGAGNGQPLTAPDPKVQATVLGYVGQQAGVRAPYVYGAAGPGSYDCSGLMLAAYATAAVTLPRVSEDQWRAGPAVPSGELQPGDLVFFDPDRDGRPGHVGMYVGAGYMIDAPHTGSYVRQEPVAGFGVYLGAVRPDPPARPRRLGRPGRLATVNPNPTASPVSRPPPPRAHRPADRPARTRLIHSREPP